ncbi:hypothetical protein SH501x_003415 [Pirellulaceae bacterium SH501]
MSNGHPGMDPSTFPAPNGQYVYECNGSDWVLVSGNPGPGYYCQPTLGGCSPIQYGLQRIELAVPVPPQPA